MQVTALYSFPGRLYSLVQAMKSSGTQVDSMRKLCVGGGPVNEALARHVLDAFPKLRNLRNLYGLVECGGLLTSPGLSEINCVDVGFPTPNVELKPSFGLSGAGLHNFPIGAAAIINFIITIAVD
ncbi:hypothetical protein HPB48_020431 [Haemaphysalis longicornis]|uniref:AMP-dependent synthetase/ligase domain-containing protein n=1 Tax=Haemaphysalis longicornis TaxID=44386 RepID=A0A9J6H5P7_HAELO|nr:hypothetical protein HPB48_020431 [Haemaphysalis longicornis]